MARVRASTLIMRHRPQQCAGPLLLRAAPRAPRPHARTHAHTQCAARAVLWAAWPQVQARIEAARIEEARRREREQAQAAVGNIINFASRAANEVLGGGAGAGKAGKKQR